MKNVILILLLVYSVAAEANFGPKRRRTAAPTDDNKIQFNLQTGFVTINGDYGGTFLGGFLVRPYPECPLLVGVESGVMYGSGTGLPILLTFKYPFKSRYSFKKKMKKKLRMYLAGSMGPVIGVSDGTLGKDNFDGRTEGVRLAMLLRHGVEMKLTHTLTVFGEMQVGGLTGLFYVSPQLGVSIRF